MATMTIRLSQAHPPIVSMEMWVRPLAESQRLGLKDEATSLELGWASLAAS